MTSEQFDQLVTRIQTRYGSRPRALRWRIALLVGLGYAGFLAVLLFVLVLSAALVAGALFAGHEPSILLMAVVAVLLAFGLCQAMVFLWVPLERLPGRDVTRDEAPQLFQLFDILQAELAVARFDHVRITSEFNASVQMIPRLGVFGFNPTCGSNRGGHLTGTNLAARLFLLPPRDEFFEHQASVLALIGGFQTAQPTTYGNTE